MKERKRGLCGDYVVDSFTFWKVGVGEDDFRERDKRVILKNDYIANLRQDQNKADLGACGKTYSRKETGNQFQARKEET